MHAIIITHAYLYNVLEPTIEAITASVQHDIQLIDEEIACDIEFEVRRYNAIIYSYYNFLCT